MARFKPRTNMRHVVCCEERPPRILATNFGAAEVDVVAFSGYAAKVATAAQKPEELETAVEPK